MLQNCTLMPEQQTFSQLPVPEPEKSLLHRKRIAKKSASLHLASHRPEATAQIYNANLINSVNSEQKMYTCIQNSLGFSLNDTLLFWGALSYARPRKPDSPDSPLLLVSRFAVQRCAFCTEVSAADSFRNMCYFFWKWPNNQLLEKV